MFKELVEQMGSANVALKQMSYTNMSESNTSLNDREPPSRKRPGTAKVSKKKSDD